MQHQIQLSIKLREEKYCKTLHKCRSQNWVVFFPCKLPLEGIKLNQACVNLKFSSSAITTAELLHRGAGAVDGIHISVPMESIYCTFQPSDDTAVARDKHFCTADVPHLPGLLMRAASPAQTWHCHQQECNAGHYVPLQRTGVSKCTASSFLTNSLS